MVVYVGGAEVLAAPLVADVGAFAAGFGFVGVGSGGAELGGGFGYDAPIAAVGERLVELFAQLHEPRGVGVFGLAFVRHADEGVDGGGAELALDGGFVDGIHAGAVEQMLLELRAEADV